VSCEVRKTGLCWVDQGSAEATPAGLAVGLSRFPSSTRLGVAARQTSDPGTNRGALRRVKITSFNIIDDATNIEVLMHALETAEKQDHVLPRRRRVSSPLSYDTNTKTSVPHLLSTSHPAWNRLEILPWYDVNFKAITCQKEVQTHSCSGTSLRRNLRADSPLVENGRVSCDAWELRVHNTLAH
jgi:hypothetical protein